MKLVGKPWRFARGPMTWESFGPWFASALKDAFRFSDIQDPEQLPLAGRTVTIPTLMTYIGNTGQAVSQRLLNVVAAGNKSSTQSVQPLTGVDVGAGVARVDIASHNVQYDFGLVAYNSGSITGLANSTEYFVYSDDPSYAGGAVTYLATTNPNIVTANSGRYYLGKVTTPAGGGGNTGGGGGGGAGGGGTLIP